PLAVHGDHLVLLTGRLTLALAHLEAPALDDQVVVGDAAVELLALGDPFLPGQRLGFCQFHAARQLRGEAAKGPRNGLPTTMFCEAPLRRPAAGAPILSHDIE